MVHKLIKKRETDFIKLVQDEGVFVSAYPVDESQEVSNAGDAELFKFGGKKYEIITWNESAVEHNAGEQEIGEVSD